MSQFEKGQSGNPGGAPPKALRLSERRRDVLMTEFVIDLDTPEWNWLRAFYPKTNANVKELKAMAKRLGLKGYSKMNKPALMQKLGMVNGRISLPLDTINTLRRVYLFASDTLETPDYRAIQTLEDRTEGPMEKETAGEEGSQSIAFIAFVGSEEHKRLQTGQRERMLDNPNTIDGSFKEK